MYSNLLIVKKIAPIVIKAGEIILSAKENKGVDSKLNIRDLVTEYDKKVQDFLIKNLKEAFPNSGFVAEEEGVGKEVNPYEGEIFIIDPIDGTANFVNSLALSVISVAYLVDGVQTAGVVYNPYNGEMFYAERGKGAYLNGKNIMPSETPLKNGLVAVGTATYYEEFYDWSKKSVVKMYDACMDFRRLGTSALEICYVAMGRLCAFYEIVLCPHDYGAASLIAKEAGAICTTLEGEELPMHKKTGAVCANSTCYAEVMELLKSI